MALILVIVISSRALAWGRRGHATIAEVAAYLVSDKVACLKNHSFDLGYYANTPDFVWKQDKFYKAEHPEHYMDWEIFERALGKDFKATPNRKEFFSQHK